MGLFKRSSNISIEISIIMAEWLIYMLPDVLICFANSDLNEQWMSVATKEYISL